MPRPRTPVGGHGEIKIKPVGGKFEARCRYCDKDGELRQLRRVGNTEAQAKANLKKRLAEVVEEMFSGKINSDTRFKVVAWAWHAEFREKAILGGKSPKSVRIYKSMLNNHILPKCGELAMKDVTVGVLDSIIKAVHKAKSSDSAKTCRSVLGGIGGYAVRNELWEYNRGQQVDEIQADDRPDVVALDVDQLDRLRADVTRVVQARQTDKLGRPLGRRGLRLLQIPDLVDAGLSTSCRLGELLALAGGEFGRDSKGRPVVWINSHLVRADNPDPDAKGTTISRREYRKGSKSRLVLVVPEWSVPMWSRLALATAPNGPFWPSMRGEWQDPDGMSRLIGAVLDEAGWGWVTAHVLRKTVGDALDDAGMSAEEVAAQLGNSARVARKHYTRLKARNDKQAAVLEALGRKRKSPEGPNAGAG